MPTGICYVIATPIGNLDDISKRALDLLASADLIAAEDTRHSARLLQHYEIKTRMVSMHAHNEAGRVQQLIGKLKEGRNIAVISDAGTPVISDPGFDLVRHAREAGISVVPVPGACAAIAALSASGLPADKFIFEGFLPVKTAARKARLQELNAESRTMIFYESPRRVLSMLQDVAEVFGGERFVVIARELTKQFETIYGDQVAAVVSWMKQDENQQKGEFVVMVHGAAKTQLDEQEALRVLKLLLPSMPVKQAAQIASEITGFKKNALYQLALKIV